MYLRKKLGIKGAEFDSVDEEEIREGGDDEESSLLEKQKNQSNSLVLETLASKYPGSG
jgi:hypothetical protein